MTKEFKTWNDAVLIPTEKLTFTDWNINSMSDEEFAALCHEIQEHGFDEPCQVVPVGDKYLVLGGEHRTRASLALGLEHVPCCIKENLTDAEEKDLIIYSVKRNNIRGKIDAQKYAKLEQRLAEKWSISSEAAKREMLVKQELIRNIRRSTDDQPQSLNLSGVDFKDEEDGESTGNRRGNGKGKFANRRALLMALRNAEQDVLLQSDDTLEHNYLFFSQSGGQHLIVNEDVKLASLVSDMVQQCKQDEKSVIEFLKSAITNELQKQSKESW